MNKLNLQEIEPVLNLLSPEDKQTFTGYSNSGEVFEVTLQNDNEVDYSRNFPLKVKSLWRSDFPKTVQFDYFGWIDRGNGLNTLFLEKFDGHHIYDFIVSTSKEVLEDCKRVFEENGLESLEDVSILSFLDSQK